MEIKDVVGRQIIDSRGNPTVEVDIILQNGSLGRASAPAGMSKGILEAVELRDGLKEYSGKSVHSAIDVVNGAIKNALVGIMADDQFKIDGTLIDLDGSSDMSVIGANSSIAVSIACAKAAAASRNIPLWRQIADIAGSTPSIPMPMVNILNGGVHAHGASSIQECMIVPVGATSIQDALRYCSEVFHELGNILKANGHKTTVGDEGGYAPSTTSTTASLDYIITAIAEAGYEPLEQVSLALDVGASQLYSENEYFLASENRRFTGNELIAFYVSLCKTYPIISIEDGLAESDWKHWSTLTALVSEFISVVTDDLTVTRKDLLQKAIDKKAGNTILLKPNQVGTITATIETSKLAKSAGWKTIISHRSGDTEDSAIADIAVGLGVDYLKAGSMSRSERLAKYNQLLRISESLETHSSSYKNRAS